MDTPIVGCMNCGKRAPASEFRLCFEVLVCRDCHTIANIIHERGKSELRQLQTLLQESIRLALMEGRLSFQTNPESKPSKRDILKTIVQLVEMRDGRNSTAVHGAVGGRVQDTVPVPGVPWEGDGVEAGRGAQLEGGADGAAGPHGPDDRKVPSLQALQHDGGAGPGPSVAR